MMTSFIWKSVALKKYIYIIKSILIKYKRRPDFGWRRWLSQIFIRIIVSRLQIITKLLIIANTIFTHIYRVCMLIENIYQCIFFPFFFISTFILNYSTKNEKTFIWIVILVEITHQFSRSAIANLYYSLFN